MTGFEAQSGEQKGKVRASVVAQTVKNLTAMQDTWVRSLGREDPLKEGMATHASILAWRIPWTGSLAGYLHSVAENQT